MKELQHPQWIAKSDLHLWYALRAMLAVSGETGLPQSHHRDLAIDAMQAKSVTRTRFVWVLRDCGTQLCCNLLQLDVTAKVAGADNCHFYTYDENDVREGDALCEPQMHEVTIDEARAFLSARRNQSNA